MQPLLKRTKELLTEIDAATSRLHLADKQTQLVGLEDELAAPEIWNNPSYAQEISKKAASLSSMIEPWTTLRSQVADIEELMEIGDDSLTKEFEGQISAFEIII